VVRTIEIIHAKRDRKRNLTDMMSMATTIETKGMLVGRKSAMCFENQRAERSAVTKK
jgi:hypothetical protein